MVGHGGSSAGSYLADPTSPIPSYCASIVATSTLRVKTAGFGPTGIQTLDRWYTHSQWENFHHAALHLFTSVCDVQQNQSCCNMIFVTKIG